MRKVKTHNHHYIRHPNPNWQTHVACSICGFAIPKDNLTYAIEQGASADKALSAYVTKRVFRQGKGEVTVQIGSRFIALTLIGDKERSMTDSELIDRAEKQLAN